MSVSADYSVSIKEYNNIRTVIIRDLGMMKKGKIN